MSGGNVLNLLDGVSVVAAICADVIGTAAVPAAVPVCIMQKMTKFKLLKEAEAGSKEPKIIERQMFCAYANAN